MPLPSAMLSALRSLDWTDVAAVQVTTRDVLRHIGSDPELLSELVHQCESDEHLFGMCEHYDILDKIILHSDDSGFRLRLHIFGPGYFDRPHNHRWVYTNLVLKGRYQHDVFLISMNEQEVQQPLLTPIMSRVEDVGNSYTLNVNVAHSIKAEPYTTTLILRGPAVTDRFIVTDRVTGKSWWQYGAAQETAEARSTKRMDPALFQSLRAQLVAAQLIAG